ncbi:DUF5103 domain-containing protein [Bacteroidia bacterium]|nr:DUF5103 domain-containing protein [Bacteroidia bacterium]
MGAHAQKFRTEAFSDKIKTLRVNVVDDWKAKPIIELESDKWVELSFDVMTSSHENFTYTLTHCNADWTPSPLAQSEYMSGFQNRFIEDYAVSFNTSMDYINYRLTFPNEDLSMKISGNYVVQVFPEHENKPILSACFSVVEAGANISMTATSQTDKGMNNQYQQVNFSVTYGSDVKVPLQELKVYVQQNNRIDNEVTAIKPLSVLNKQLIYEHNPALVFDGGNEYRYFEMTTKEYNGLNIESIQFHSPYYHVDLKPEIIRSSRAYSFNEDINGRFYIRTLSGIDYDYEADYRIVHFFLPSEKPFAEDIYILSEAFNNILDERSKMEYSAPDAGYIKTVSLKEGYYNYLYVTQKDNASSAGTALIEGNFYQTENEYRVMVYFHPQGGKYDKLIGTQTIQFK